LLYEALQKLKKDHADPAARAVFERTRGDLGYALLLKRYIENPSQATPEQIKDAAWSTTSHPFSSPSASWYCSASRYLAYS
jgi:cytochrome d ubiquinol oxidase subunit I